MHNFVLNYLLLSISKSLAMWVGVIILSSLKYKWTTILACLLATIVTTYFGFQFGMQIGILMLFIVPFVFSYFSHLAWKHSFYVLTNIIALIIVSKYWADFLSWLITVLFNLNFDLVFPILSFVLQIPIAIGFFYVILLLYKGVGIHSFLTHLDKDYSSILIFILSFMLSFYFVISFIPNLLNMDCLQIIFVQTVFATFLTFMAAAVLLLFRSIVGKECRLRNRNATLDYLNINLSTVQSKLNDNYLALYETKVELENSKASIDEKILALQEKEQLIQYLDQKIINLSKAQQKLFDFEHDQLNLMITLEGAIKSGDTNVMLECLEQYGASVQEVLELKPNSPYVGGLTGSSMMPIRHLILAKSQLALNEDIRFTVEIPDEISVIGMDLKDFVRILGIWLDNALEEAIHTDEKWIHTSLFLSKDEDDENLSVLEIRVSNSCRPILPIDISNLHQQGETSKKGKNRGTGLRIVHDLIIKHEHIYMSTIVKENETKFTQFLSIAIENNDD